ncbi:MAG: hypothetical protein ACI88H_000194 [Cocleimonas sp.]|jgi:Fe-S cluster biosynthesis and repair protein YggX
MDKKIARLCWNQNDWVSPSGSEGKSLDKKSFEYTRGYGHEEWLRDTTKLINGYKFSFLQPVNTKNKKHQGQEYAIWLYTQKDNQKLCLGYIKHAICITREEAKEAVQTHEKKGWLKEMKIQLESLNIDTSMLVENDSLDNFNIKYKPTDFVWFKEPIDITTHYGNNRYVLMSLIDPEFKIQHLIEDSLAYDLNEIFEDDLSKSEVELLTLARIGQGKFRRNVIELWQGEKCAVTLVSIKELLIASHIKAWKDCDNTDERLDGANGLLLCAHVDKLFDNHLATFLPRNNRYYLVLSSNLETSQLKGLGIERDIELNTSHLDFDALDRFKVYMAHHNDIYKSKQNQQPITRKQ